MLKILLLISVLLFLLSVHVAASQLDNTSKFQEMMNDYNAVKIFYFMPVSGYRKNISSENINIPSRGSVLIKSILNKSGIFKLININGFSDNYAKNCWGWYGEMPLLSEEKNKKREVADMNIKIASFALGNELIFNENNLSYESSMNKIFTCMEKEFYVAFIPALSR
jgi:hypothetical protein